MKIVVLYLCPLDDQAEFAPKARRWFESYQRFKPAEAHQVMICFTNGEPTPKDLDPFNNVLIKTYSGGGRDIGAYLSVAKVADCDLMVFMNARSHFWRHGWLGRFITAYKTFGPKGLYGSSASFEVCPLNHKVFPNPHIRTTAFATDPKILRRYPFEVNSLDDGFRFESGQWNFTDWYESRGYPVKMVAWDGIYDKADWRKPTGIFRRGNQENVLIRDRHTDIYSAADKAARDASEAAAGYATVKIAS